MRSELDMLLYGTPNKMRGVISEIKTLTDKIIDEYFD